MPVPPPRSLFAGSLDLRAWRLEGQAQPLLLVSAPKKSGSAVARNRFKRRVRAAFLAELRRQDPGSPFVLWVRPARGGACSHTYRDIEAQVRRALDRWGASSRPDSLERP
ncbi:MAG TPA: ribonuclease P protein component [Holophagaceae bacterium]|nr:ribonuclease P protein component [Holophagaceae bacterium]